MNQKAAEDLTFGEWLRQRRRILDLTQQELADQAGCARITLRRIEAGALKPSKELALILLERLGAPNIEREAWLRFARGLSGFPKGSAESPATQPLINLPTFLTSFIGRQQEQVEIKKLIANNRLVTLTGAGGIGKTRLSIQVAFTLLNHFPSGTWLVELAPLSDSALIPQVVLTALGLKEQSGRPLIRILIDFLREKRALLILDNCEHLVAACAQLCHDLLTHCSTLQILTTSREPLEMSGEVVWQVRTLSVPDKDRLSLTNLPLFFESVRLFVERAKAIKSDFALTDRNEVAVTKICKHLDGIPLALELAAARIRIMTPEEIASHLDDSFELLKQGRRTVIPHHQTLRATFDWSFDLLIDQERVLFRRLSVFAGGWTLKAAETIGSDQKLEKIDILATLSHLVDKSLVNVETRNGASRFQMLETIREYAHEKLFESKERELVHGSHLDFFVNWMQQVEPKLHGPEQIFWMDQIETEHDNLRVALQWATNNNIKTGLRLASFLGWFWFVRGYATEGIKWLNGLITCNTPQTEAQSSALAFKALLSSLTGDVQSVLKFAEIVLEHRDVGNPRWISATLRGKAIFTAWVGGDTQSAITGAEQAIALAQAVGDQWNYGMSLFALGDVYLHGAKDYAMAEHVHEKSLKVLRGIGDKFGIAHALLSLGFNYLRQGNYERAAKVETEALGLLRELGDKAGIGWTLANLYHLARFQGDYEGAQLIAEERLILWRDMGFDLQVAWATYDLGRIDIIQNNLDMAASHFEDSITFFQQKGSLKDKILCLVGPAQLLLAQGKREHATQLFAAFDTLSKENHIELEIGDQAGLDNILTKLRTQLDETQFARAWSEGEKMPLADALSLVSKNLEET